MNTKNYKFSKLQEEILKLKVKYDFLILAHNYQIPEIQEIADFTADSLQLANYAKNAESADNILFAAVYFMAESGAILNPTKNVYIGNYEATCPMARRAPASLMKKIKEMNPEIPLMMYINTTAEARAQADYICTSANSLKIAKIINRPIINFAPDKNLAYFISSKLNITVNPIPQKGCCIVHQRFKADYIKEVKKKHSEALILAHPECPPEVQQIADFIGSTSQMEMYVINLDQKEFIIATEIGLLHKLERKTVNKILYKADKDPICYNMKKNSLESIKYVIEKQPKEFLVKVPEDIAEKNRILLNDMIKNSQ
ncbi:MAG: quinolinate synthase NadA [Candidatus Helarchaeota archaeon]